ncbi:MAG: nucleotide pyrophosphohydrolase [Candidatus Heimdallarchaeota archaeon]|nr:MAG: nucleotide pyrophosphohydrolase [Candidatus Heimdallarchaeota archaeon]
MEEITEKILEFRNARKWKKYHTPKNLALSLIVEIGELFELIQWQTDSEIKDEVHKIQGSLADELADVAIYLFLLAHELNINLNNAVLQKIDKNWKKYPVGSLTDEEIKWGKANN